MTKFIDWVEIIRYWEETDCSVSELQLRFQVSRKSIYNNLPIKKELGEPTEPGETEAPRSPPKVAAYKRRSIPETVLVAIDAMLDGIEDGDNSLGQRASASNALCSLIALQLKMQPITVSALVEQAIALKISPERFMHELSRQFKQEA